jgi:hypothetical protein
LSNCAKREIRQTHQHSDADASKGARSRCP